MIEQLSLQVTIPPDGKIDRTRTLGAGGFSVDIEQLRRIQCPDLSAGEARINIGGQPPAIVFPGAFRPEDPAALRINQCGANATVSANVLINTKHFKAWVFRVQIRYVQSIAMTEPSAPFRGTIVIDGHGTVNDFIFSVAIDIRYGQLMIALPGVLVRYLL